MYRNNFRRRQPSRRHQPKSFNPVHLINRAGPSRQLEVTPITHAFADFKLEPRLMQNIQQKGYPTPTPIQDQTIQPILDRRDLVGIANTGTGKTAAFLIPLINLSIKSGREKILIITPTRELAGQIQQEFVSLAASFPIASALVIGGVNISRQINRLRSQPAFVIGTPGRIKDLLMRRALNLTQFSVIVLDEVDRMLDMGFIKDIDYIITGLPANRQSLFFSATIEGAARQIMTRFLRQPIMVSVKQTDFISNVKQEIVRVEGKNKIELLRDLLIRPGFDKVLVFGRTKWGMEKLHRALGEMGIRAVTIHSNKSQNQRQNALKQFKAGQVKVMLATDVAQRGLDIDNVTHVINFDLPETQEDYIHRIGRTGRANKQGIALTFV